MSDSRETKGRERRVYPRYPVTNLRVDYAHDEHFLFAPIENISEMGIFIRSDAPLETGTRLHLSFALEGGTERLALEGVVVWINPKSPDSSSPGMGVQFTRLTKLQREAVVELVRAVAYLQ